MLGMEADLYRHSIGSIDVSTRKQLRLVVLLGRYSRPEPDLHASAVRAHVHCAEIVRRERTNEFGDFVEDTETR